MDRRENSRKRTQSTQRKFGLSIAVIRRPDRRSISPAALRSFAAIHFERDARQPMAAAAYDGVNASNPERVSSLRRAQDTTGQTAAPIADY
jgi:hypothetical protein